MVELSCYTPIRRESPLFKKDYTTEHRKEQHLTNEERHIIEVRFNKDKQTIYGIAKEIGRPYNTVKNEIARGTVVLYRGNVTRYKQPSVMKCIVNTNKNADENTAVLKHLLFYNMSFSISPKINGHWMFVSVEPSQRKNSDEKKPSAPNIVSLC